VCLGTRARLTRFWRSLFVRINLEMSATLDKCWWTRNVVRWLLLVFVNESRLIQRLTDAMSNSVQQSANKLNTTVLFLFTMVSVYAHSRSDKQPALYACSQLMAASQQWLFRGHSQRNTRSQQSYCLLDWGWPRWDFKLWDYNFFYYIIIITYLLHISLFLIFDVDDVRYVCACVCVVSCSLSTFYSRTTGLCETCPAGTYQDLEGQMSCKPCPHQLRGVGVEGAVSAAECGGWRFTLLTINQYRTYFISNESYA